MFLTKKKCGHIKGCRCEDGKKEGTYAPNGITSTFTIATEALMLSCIINAMEGRDAAIVNIPGAFVQVDMDEIFHMKIEATMAELLAKLDLKLY
eukprot:6362793-Ditylum_brightwellii.AAC.1